jgi:sulfur carrier protein ThiS
MKVFIEKENKNIDANAGNGRDLLKSLNINPSTVILVRNDEVILEEESLDDADIIKILSVISGG